MTRTFTLGRYTCVERLGTSPVGELWRAKRFGLIGVERQFLLTRMHAPLSKDEAALARLQASLKIASELELERSALGLLRLCEQTTQGPEPHFVVCEFPGFADLRKLRSGLDLVVAKERIAGLWPAIVAFVGRSLSGTLAAAHERGLWHGLLSPASVWISAEGHVLLADLGLAQVLQAAAWQSDPNLKQIQGYLPKEVQAGNIAPSSDCDIFALGVLLNELLGKVSGTAETKGLLDGLRRLISRASAATRAERAASMRELAQGFESLPLGAPLLRSAKETLAHVAEHFQLFGDTVPQPVTLSDRSSAEPLPPPPGGKPGDSKLNAPNASAKNRSSIPVDKPDKNASQAAARAGVESRQPARPKGRPVEVLAEIRSETDDTPLPASRPLLATGPKLPALNDDTGRKLASAARSMDDATPTPGATFSESKKLRSSSREDLRPRSGIDWLTSKSDKLATEPIAEKLEAEKTSPKKSTGSMPVVAARKATVPPTGTADRAAPDEKPASAGRISSPASAPAGQAADRRRSNPVSVNPRARSTGRTNQAVSASTPTAEVDVATASAEFEVLEREAGSQSSSASTLRRAAAALSGTDPLGASETSPQLTPIKVLLERSRLDEEPTNPVSLEEVAKAAALADEPSPQLRRRSGPISEPSARVLSNTAPAQIVPETNGLESPAVQAPGPKELAPQSAADVSVGSPEEDVKEQATAKKPRLALFAGGSLALLLACGFLYWLVAAPTAGTSSGKPDLAPPAQAMDGGTAKESSRIPPDTLVLSSTPEATVLIDGSEKGKTPLTLKLREGQHKLLLVAEEYVLLRREVSGGSKLDLKLERAKLPDDVAGEAMLKIKCKSEGKLRILVDGNDSGRTCPSEDLSLAAGKHVLGFLDPTTDETKEKKIKAKAGKKPTKVKVKF